MKEDPMNPLIDDHTEGLSVALPELFDAPIGYRVRFMVGPEDVTFEVTGHAKRETQLIRVRQEKRRTDMSDENEIVKSIAEWIGNATSDLTKVGDRLTLVFRGQETEWEIVSTAPGGGVRCKQVGGKKVDLDGME